VASTSGRHRDHPGSYGPRWEEKGVLIDLHQVGGDHFSQNETHCGWRTNREQRGKDHVIERRFFEKKITYHPAALY